MSLSLSCCPSVHPGPFPHGRPPHTLASLCLGPSDVAQKEQCDVLSLPARRLQNPAAQQKDTLTCREKEAHTSPAPRRGRDRCPKASQRRFPVLGPAAPAAPRCGSADCHRPQGFGRKGSPRCAGVGGVGGAGGGDDRLPVPHRQGSSLGSERARDARWTRAGDRARAGTVLGVRAWAEPMLILHVQADPPRQPRTHPCNPKETQGSPVTVLSERGRSAAPALPAPRPRSRNRGRDSPPSPVPEAKASCRHAGTAPCRMVEALPQVRARTDPNPRARGTGRATASPQPYWELQQPPAAHRHGSNPWRSSEVCFAAGHQDRTQVTSGMEGAEPTLRTTMGFPCLGGGGFCSQGKGRIPPPPPFCHGRTPLQPATFTVARLD